MRIRDHPLEFPLFVFEEQKEDDKTKILPLRDHLMPLHIVVRLGKMMVFEYQVIRLNDICDKVQAD